MRGYFVLSKSNKVLSEKKRNIYKDILSENMNDLSVQLAPIQTDTTVILANNFIFHLLWQSQRKQNKRNFALLAKLNTNSDLPNLQNRKKT